MAAAPTRFIFTLTLFLGFLAAALAAGENSASEALALKPEPLAPKLEPKNMRRKVLDENDDYCDDNILNAAGCALDAAANAAADVANDLIDTANQVANGVNDVANDVVNTANNVANDVVDQVNDAATSFTNGFNNAYNAASQASGAFVAGQCLWVTMIIATLVAAAATM